MNTIKTLTLLALMATPTLAQVRLKDIATVEGVRNNVLNGVGLVVGLNGTGDRDQTRFTNQALSNALARNGISLDPTTVKVKNVAAVMVSAELPPFAQSGSRIDVTVSSIGDAGSLQGGTLLWTELKGPDGRVYAVAQGPLSIGGFTAGGGGASVTQNHPTTGRIPDGGMVERQVPYDFLANNKIRFILRDSDFTTMQRAVDVVNNALGSEFAHPLNARTFELFIPSEYAGNMVYLISKIENLTVTPDTSASVVVNERTGTIIMGQNVKIDHVAIAHGNLTIIIQDENLAVPAQAFTTGQTVTQTNSSTVVEEQGSQIYEFQQSVTLGDIAEALNALKVTPRDIIAILQAMKQAGALHADLKLI